MSWVGWFAIISLCFLMWQHSTDVSGRVDELKEQIKKLEARLPAQQAEASEQQALLARRDARIAAEKAATERNERNREIKRRAKERKAEAQRGRLIRAVAQSMEYEQELRNDKAAERGWSVHPNDMELEGEERAEMLEAWRTGGAQPEYHSSK